MNEEASLGTFSAIVCSGVKSIIVSDDISAKNIASGSHLKLWRDSEESNLWIDRFDARNELDVIELKQLHDALSKAQFAPGACEYMLDDSETPFFEDLVMERFQDLLDFKEEDLSRDQPLSPINDPDCLKSSNDATKENDAMGLRWGYQSDRTEFWIRPLREPYVVPLIWDVPSEIKLPMTKKQFDVIVHTVKNIRNKGSQFEILLKFKESDTNPIFDFLNVDCDLHELFEYIKRISVDTFQAGLLLPIAASSKVQIHDIPTSDDIQEVEHESTEIFAATSDIRAVIEVPNALFLLGDTYGEDSSSDTEAEAEAEGDGEVAEEVDDFSAPSDNCDSVDKNGNPLVQLFEPIEIDDENDSGSVSTASTASFPSESCRSKCSDEFEYEAPSASMSPLEIAPTDDLIGGDKAGAEDTTVSSYLDTTQNKTGESLDEVIGDAYESILNAHTAHEVMEEGEVNESEDESGSCKGSVNVPTVRSAPTIESENNEEYSLEARRMEREPLDIPPFKDTPNEDSANNSEESKSPHSADADADAESNQNIQEDDKEDQDVNLGPLDQACSCLELTSQLSILDTEMVRLSLVDDDLLDDDVDQNDFWGTAFTLKIQSIELLRDLAEKKSKIIQHICDLKTALEVRKKKADRLKRVKLLKQQFEAKAALDKIEALKLKDDNMKYNVLDAIALRNNEAEKNSSDESSSSGEIAREKVRSKQRERADSCSTDSSRDLQTRHRRKAHGRDKERVRRRSRSRSRERDRKKKKVKEKERDREKERTRGHGRSKTHSDLNRERGRSNCRQRFDTTSRNGRKRPSSRSRSLSRSPVRSRRTEDSAPAIDAAPSASALDFKDKIRVALGVEPLKQPAQAAPVPFRDRIQMALDTLK